MKENISESQIYSILLNYEHRLDTLLSEKKQHMRQLLLNNETTRETLRIYVSHQRKPISKTEEEWRVGIQGGIVRTSTNLAAAEQYKFTNFLKSMSIELDRNIFTGGEDFIEWNAIASQPLKDGFTFSRKVNLQNLQNLPGTYQLRVVFHIKQDPPLYNVTPTLNQVISNTSEYYRCLDRTSQSNEPPTFTLNQILNMIWEYITKNQLYDMNDQSAIKLDPLLRQLLEDNTLTCSTYAEILKKIKPHLLIPLSSSVVEIIHPIQFHVTDLTNTSTTSGSSKRDVPVQVVTPQQAKLNSTIEKILSEEPSEDVETINKNIQSVIQEIKQHSEKMKFMKKFSDDPVNTIHSLIDSQTRDLLILHKKQSIEEARKSSFYKPCDWINTALQKYLTNNDSKYRQN